MEAGRCVLVAECHEVWGDDVVVGGCEAGSGEGAGNELAGGRIGGWRRPMWVKSAPVVFGWAELVSARC